jgi:hypothetical protein
MNLMTFVFAAGAAGRPASQNLFYGILTTQAMLVNPRPRRLGSGNRMILASMLQMWVHQG